MHKAQRYDNASNTTIARSITLQRLTCCHSQYNNALMSTSGKIETKSPTVVTVAFPVVWMEEPGAPHTPVLGQHTHD